VTKQLERSARGGNLLAAFELYQRGTDNSPSDEIIEKAEEWFSICWNYLQNAVRDDEANYKPENAFCIRTLSLTDYRRFSHLDVNFEDDLTIIIGNNGRGKTSILSAIAKTLSWFSANILKEDSSGQRLSEYTDIKNDSVDKFTDVSTSFFFGKGLKHLSVRLSRSALGVAERRESIVKPAKSFGDIWRIINETRTVNLPTFAYYSVERSHPLSKPAKDGTDRRDDRFDAYNHALTGPGRFDHFVEWFIALHKRREASSSSQLDELQTLVRDLQRSVDGGMLSLRPLLDDARRKIQIAQLKDVTTAKNMHSVAAQMTIVASAITAVVPSISNIWVETASGADVIKVTNDQQDVSVDQISDGQRVFLALVADLARRLVMLNPVLVNPLAGRGIVLIDELELHLHPQWQQDVVTNLRAVFPNVQFIITTHSPIILSTAEKRCIRVFGENRESAESFLELPPIQTRGSENAEILEQVMKVFSLPPNVEEAQWLDDFELALTGEYKDLSETARTIYDKIKGHFGPDSPELKKADSLIRLRRMKARISEAKREKGSEG